MAPPRPETDDDPDAAARPVDARRRFVHEHGPWLSRYVRWLGWDPVDADDIVQESLVAALTARSEPRSDAQMRSFLRETARRVAAASRRRRRRVFAIPPEECDLHFVESERVRDERLDALRSCLEALPARAREALAFFYEGGLSRAAIAEQIGLGVGGVK